METSFIKDASVETMVVAFRKGIMFSQKFLEIHKDKLVFRKGKKPNDEVDFEIRKEQIKRISSPKSSFGSNMWKGKTFFALYYQENGEEKEINFWPGVANYIDANKLNEMIEKIESNFGLKMPEEEKQEITSFGKNIAIYSASAIFGFFWAGVFGVIMFSITAAITDKVLRKEDLNPAIKGVIIGVSYFAAFIIGTGIVWAIQSLIQN